ncbi:MAG: mechanosensitive ion channel family protein [Candidatus Parcubacteria bacterium]|nr:mechanosensitive ion channel family protein [Candidatus Parcubacteria bacterium]
MFDIVSFKNYLSETLSNRPEVLNRVYWGNALFDYLIAIFFFLIIILVLIIFKEVILTELKRLTKITKIKFDDLIVSVIDSVGWPLLTLISFYLSFSFIYISPIVWNYISIVFFILLVYYATKIIQIIVQYCIKRAIAKDEADGHIDSPALWLVGKFLKILIWVGAFAIVLRHFGYNITALIAGLGITGIAIAFALQNVLTDIFASFSIYIDKPFKIGDFVSIGEEMGEVRNIGIKSTRLQSLKGEELIVSNKQLTEARIHNYGRMKKRRSSFLVGVSYETPYKKLQKIPDIIGKVLKKIEGVEIDRVYLKELGTYNLSFEVSFFFNSTNYNDFTKAREMVNLGIIKSFEKEKISIVNPPPQKPNIKK